MFSALRSRFVRPSRNHSILPAAIPLRKRLRRGLRRAAFLAIMFTSILGLLVNQTQAYNEYYIRMYLPPTVTSSIGFWHQPMNFLRQTLGKLAIAFEGGDPPAGFPAPKGAPRRWHLGKPVGLYSEVNLANGRVLTTIPITGFYGGRGPDVDFRLYHNQCSLITGYLPVVFEAQQGDANADGMINEGDIEPFLDIMLDPEPSPEDLEIADFSEDNELGVEDLQYFETNLEAQQNISSGCTAPDWRHSYSAQVYPTSRSQITLVRDDGTVDIFTSVENELVFNGPPGVFETIEITKPQGVITSYLLTTKAQTRARFFGNDAGVLAGKLDWIADAAPEERFDNVSNRYVPVNSVICRYITTVGSLMEGKLKSVDVAANDRRVVLCYSTDPTDPNSNCHGLCYDFLPTYPCHTGIYNGGRITAIYMNDMVIDVARRHRLLYQNPSNPSQPPTQGGAGPLITIEDPMANKINFTYTSEWDLASTTDKQNNAHHFSYSSGRLLGVTDPSPFNYQHQHFEYAATTDGLLRTQYTDRRGKTWYYYFHNQTENLAKIKDPLQHTQQFVYGETEPLLVHERTQYFNALGNHWDMDYDDATGNLRILIDPMQHKWQFDYDGLNNLTAMTPPGPTALSLNTNKKISIEYTDAGDPQAASHLPTLPKKIIEPSTTSNPADTAVTTIQYYHDINYQRHYGKPKIFDTPHTFAPVATEFTTYHGDGRLAAWLEGPSTVSQPPAPASVVPVTGNSEWEPLTGDLAGGCSGGFGSSPSYDDNGNVSNNDCTSSCKIQWKCVNCWGGEECALCAAPDEGPGLDPNRLASFPSVGAVGAIPFHHWVGPGDVPITGCMQNIQRNANGQITQYVSCISGPPGAEDSGTRSHNMSYDELNCLKSSSVVSTEATSDNAGPPFTRTFHYDPNLLTGQSISTGPDGTYTFSNVDDVGRLKSLVRTNPQGQIVQSMEVELYDEADRVREVSYGNGARTLYEYDDANRLTNIEHRSAINDALIQKLEYTWTSDGLVDYVKETQPDENFPQNTVESHIEYSYDNRNRLTEEKRTGANPYWMAYTYDKAGNRLTKVEKNTTTETVTGTTDYTYDVEAPEVYGSQGNRLMKTARYDGTQQSGELIENTYYLYDKGGHVDYVVIEEDPTSASPTYTGTQLYYNTQGLIYLAWKVSWQGEWSETNPPPLTYLSAMEYRYDSARQRYRVQARDPREKVPTPQGPVANDHFLYPWSGGEFEWPASEGKWSDYVGNSIHGDYAVNVQGGSASPVEKTAHTPGLAQTTWPGGQPPSADDTSYLHGNRIGTTERITDDGGAVANRTVMTAFGEPIFSSHTPQATSRFGYAGAHGYQSSPYRSSDVFTDPITDLGWLHVGARYYDPASGRFVQRDPIGMAGGTNVYVYMMNSPIISADPSGLNPWAEFQRIQAAIAAINNYVAQNLATMTMAEIAIANAELSRLIRNATLIAELLLKQSSPGCAAGVLNILDEILRLPLFLGIHPALWNQGSSGPYPGQPWA